MLLPSYYAPNYAGIIGSGLAYSIYVGCLHRIYRHIITFSDIYVINQKSLCAIDSSVDPVIIRDTNF